jgi:deazaflavin-dependent oxidoreductase (nitroreductase family)
MSVDDGEVGEQLVGWGKSIEITTRGRLSGRAVQAVVGFVEDPDGSLLVAAGDPTADWALNLLADRSCRVVMAGRAWEAVAEPLAGPEFARAIRELILKHGTPAERLGRGPAFRLRPGS